jgi:hypothetical protein
MAFRHLEAKKANCRASGGLESILSLPACSVRRGSARPLYALLIAVATGFAARVDRL